MATDSNTGDVRAMVRTLGAHGPVMVAHYKPDNGSGRCSPPTCGPPTATWPRLAGRAVRYELHGSTNQAGPPELQRFGTDRCPPVRAHVGTIPPVQRKKPKRRFTGSGPILSPVAPPPRSATTPKDLPPVPGHTTPAAREAPSGRAGPRPSAAWGPAPGCGRWSATAWSRWSRSRSTSPCSWSPSGCCTGRPASPTS
jgi:hypothetical protein